MNIRDKRIKKEINSIIKANLSRGYLPASSEVIGLLSQYISSRNLNMPTFEFVHFYSDFSLSALNMAKATISTDLDTVYEAIVDLYNEADKQIDKFETEKKKYDYRLNEIESELANLVNKYSANGYTDAAIENIVDMQHFDIAQSTCDIDLQNREITLKKLSDIPYTGEMIITVKSSDQLQSSGNVLDYIGKTGMYWSGVVSKPAQEETWVDFIIDLQKEAFINKLEFNFPLIKPAVISIYTSKDTDRWSNGYEDLTSGRVVVNTDGTFRYIKVRISKTEADKFKSGLFEYHYLVDTIRLFLVNYATESTIITKPITFDANVNRVSLVEKSLKPASTNIDFYVALNTSTPEWIPITPINQIGENKIVSFNTIETGRSLDVSLPKDISGEAYELKHLSTNGQHIYAIAEVNDVTITSNRLYKGVNAWRVDSISRQADGPLDEMLFIENPTEIVTSYKPMLFGKPSLIINNEIFTEPTVLKFTTTIECPGVDQIIKSPIASRYPITVYLNGSVLYKGVPTGFTTITYPFKARKNIIEVIVNINSANNGDTAATSVDLNVNLMNLASYVYADPEPLREVSLFNLRYNTNNQKDVYALKPTNQGYVVLVKDDNLKVDYRLVYDYITEDTKEILVKAVLKREYASINLTPKLKGYEVRII